MNQDTMIIRNVILRAEKNTFIVRIILTVIGYVGITFSLNTIRPTAPIWVVWIIVGVQLFLFLTFFVICSLRLRQCRKQSWWLHIALISDFLT